MELTANSNHLREAIRHRWAEKYCGKFEGWELTTEELNNAVAWVIAGGSPVAPFRAAIEDACIDLWDFRMEKSQDYHNECHDNQQPECDERDECTNGNVRD